jgi:type VI protein secretion system component Hcp
VSTDIFLALKRVNKDFAIKGESLDEQFKDGWIELQSFDIDCEFDATQLIHQSTSVKHMASKLGALLAARFGQPAGAAPAEAEDEDPIPVFYFKVTKFLDAASPFLYLNYCQGASKKPDKIDTALVTIRKAGRFQDKEGERKYGLAYLKYEFGNVWVVSYSMDHDETYNTPKETIRFCASSYYMRYHPQTGAGQKDAATSKELGWDFENNRPSSPRA